MQLEGKEKKKAKHIHGSVFPSVWRFGLLALSSGFPDLFQAMQVPTERKGDLCDLWTLLTWFTRCPFANYFGHWCDSKAHRSQKCQRRVCFKVMLGDFQFPLTSFWSPSHRLNCWGEGPVRNVATYKKEMESESQKRLADLEQAIV